MEVLFDQVTIKFHLDRTKGTNGGRLLCEDCPVLYGERLICCLHSRITKVANEWPYYVGDVVPCSAITKRMNVADLETIKQAPCQPETILLSQST